MRAIVTLTVEVPESDNETEQAALELFQWACTDAAKRSGLTMVTNHADWQEPTVRPYDRGAQWCCDLCGTWNDDFCCEGAGCDCDYESWLPIIPAERSRGRAERTDVDDG